MIAMERLISPSQVKRRERRIKFALGPYIGAVVAAKEIPWMAKSRYKGEFLEDS